MRSQKSREVAWTGMLFALAIALSFLESAITPLLGLMPAMKLGLSNLVVMYALLFLNTRTAAELVLLKALFALLTRGPIAGFLSLCGGVLSFLVLWGLLHLPASPGEFIFTVSDDLAPASCREARTGWRFTGSNSIAAARIRSIRHVEPLLTKKSFFISNSIKVSI
jgi:heptaprenyl diphosphate synthase